MCHKVFYWLIFLASFSTFIVFVVKFIQQYLKHETTISLMSQRYQTMYINRPVGRNFKLGWPIKCLFPPKVGVAHYTFCLRSAKSWGGPGHPSTYGPAYTFVLNSKIGGSSI